MVIMNLFIFCIFIRNPQCFELKVFHAEKLTKICKYKNLNHSMPLVHITIPEDYLPTKIFFP